MKKEKNINTKKKKKNIMKKTINIFKIFNTFNNNKFKSPGMTIGNKWNAINNNFKADSSLKILFYLYNNRINFNNK